MILNIGYICPINNKIYRKWNKTKGANLIVFTLQKIKAGKRRTYFFDVRRTKGEDFYITLTESTKKFNSDGYERHKIFLYKEDFNRFLAQLQKLLTM
jgi:hypothetical protein